jgi:hypothetical protein
MEEAQQMFADSSGQKAQIVLVLRFLSPEDCVQTKDPTYNNATDPKYWQKVNQVCRTEGSYLHFLSTQPVKTDMGHLVSKIRPSLSKMPLAGENPFGLFVLGFGYIPR